MSKQRKCRGFTLIEMLVVIVIIGILTGLLFRLHAAAGERAARAQTLARIENIKSCVEEYYRLHGSYPPASSDPVNKGTEYLGWDVNVAGEEWEQIQAYIAANNLDFMQSDYTGLVFSICAEPGVNFTRKESERWREYWDGGVGLDGDYVEGDLAQLGNVNIGGGMVTNTLFWLEDGWDRQFVYISQPPYQSYKLYSKGADGKTDIDDINDPDSVDDIGRAGMVE